MKLPHTTVSGSLDLAQFIKEEEQVLELETTVVLDSKMRLQHFQQQSKLVRISFLPKITQTVNLVNDDARLVAGCDLSSRFV